MSTPGGNSDDVVIHLDTVGEGKVVEALEATREAARETKSELGDLGRKGEEAGHEVESGMNAAKRGTDRARDAAGRYLPTARAAGEEAKSSGRKAREATSGWDAYSRSVRKATRDLGGFGAVMALVKFGTIIVGVLALVGAINSLAAGAVMGIGALAPMVGIIGALGPAALVAGSAMAILKLTGKDLSAMATPLRYDFMSLRFELDQKLMPSVQKFTSQMEGGLMPVLRTGLLGVADSLGRAGTTFGAMINQGQNVSRVRSIFAGLDPLIQAGGTAAGNVTKTFVNLTLAAIPMSQAMAGGLGNVSSKLEAWSERMYTSGAATRFFNNAWQVTTKVGHDLGNVITGVYRIFQIAARVGREELGGTLGSLTDKFKAWTGSAKGQSSITKYFRDAVPVLRETGKLLGALVLGLGHIASAPGMAPLIAKIRTELLPALLGLINKFVGPGGSGLGGQLVDLFTNIAQALGKIPLSSLTWILQLLGMVAYVILQIAKIPGAGPVIGFILSLILFGGAIGKLITIFTRFGKLLEWTKKPLKALFDLFRSGSTDTEAASTAAKGLGDELDKGPARFGKVTTALKEFGKALPQMLMTGLTSIWNRLKDIAASLLGIKRNGGVAGAMGEVPSTVAGPGGPVAGTGGKAAGKAAGRSAEELMARDAAGNLPLLLGGGAAVATAGKTGLFGRLGGLFSRGGGGLLSKGGGLLRGIGGLLADPLNVLFLAGMADDATGGGIGKALTWLSGGQGAAAGTGSFSDQIGNLLSGNFSKAFGAAPANPSDRWDMRNWPRMTKNGLTDAVDWIGSTLSKLTSDSSTQMQQFGTAVGNGSQAALGAMTAPWTGAGPMINSLFGPLLSLLPGFGKTPSAAPSSLASVANLGAGILPKLWHGGETPGGMALVGEHGPEPLISGGRLAGLLGARGPELANLPRGGYVVPNLSTLAAMPGLTRQIPSHVASAVSRALPAYGGAFAGDGGGAVHVSDGSERVVEAVHALTSVIAAGQREAREQPQPDIAAAIVKGLRRRERDDWLERRYRYPSTGRI